MSLPFLSLKPNCPQDCGHFADCTTSNISVRPTLRERRCVPNAFRIQMLKFLANNIEQLDLALEHCEKSDANNARFALMLVDNVVEFTLHEPPRLFGGALS